MKPKQYNKGGALKPVPSEKKGLSKLPTEVRNKMGYMMGGGKLDKMYQNGGKTDPPRKLSPDAMRLVKLGEVAKAQRDSATAAKTEKTFMTNARAQEAINLNQMRNALKSEGPASVAKFDKELKEKGYKVVQKPVKKMMAGGKMEYAIGGMMKNKVKRLENREANLVARGNKAVDEGRERKADRLLGRAARVENRVIKAKESAPNMNIAQRGEALNKFASQQAAITAKKLRNQQLDYQPGVGKPFGRESYDGLYRGKFKSDPANKLIPFAKSGGGKIDMMYQKGGKMDMMYQKGGLVPAHHQTPHDPKKLAHVGAKGAKSLSTPYNKTKDNNSYISNDVDMNPSTKKQMMALRSALMYFTGVSPKNK